MHPVTDSEELRTDDIADHAPELLDPGGVEGVVITGPAPVTGERGGSAADRAWLSAAPHHVVS